MPELKINRQDIDVVPVLKPDGFRAALTRINVELRERPERQKTGLAAKSVRTMFITLVLTAPPRLAPGGLRAPTAGLRP